MTRDSKSEIFMQKAIDKAREGIQSGQSPFGACITLNDEVVAVAHNRVWKNQDITAHAEVEAIRLACVSLKTIDLSKCTIYSTCEPCPMCFSACHWARIEKIVYGTGMEDAHDFGFHELLIKDKVLNELGGSHIEIVSGVLINENLELFREWKSLPNAQTY